MNTLDFIILAFLGVGFVIGFFKGVIQQAFSLGGLILGIIFGTLLYKPFAELILNILKLSEQTACIVAFVVILLVVPIICGLLGKLLSKLIKMACLGLVDRLLGGVFGFLKYMIILGLFIKLFNVMGVTDKIFDYEQRTESRMYGCIEQFTDTCMRKTWEKVKGTTDDLIKIAPEFKGHDNDEKPKV